MLVFSTIVQHEYDYIRVGEQSKVTIYCLTVDY